jgi:hypothetical protein
MSQHLRATLQVLIGAYASVERKMPQSQLLSNVGRNLCKPLFCRPEAVDDVQCRLPMLFEVLPDLQTPADRFWETLRMVCGIFIRATLSRASKQGQQESRGKG